MSRCASVIPRSAGASETEIPAALNASIFSAAVPFPPEMMAPACPILLPLGAVWPATNPRITSYNVCYTKLLREEIPAPYTLVDTLPEQALAADEFFVMGDNRRASVDSREFGPVGADQLLGTAVLRMARDGLSQVAALERP